MWPLTRRCNAHCYGIRIEIVSISAVQNIDPGIQTRILNGAEFRTASASLFLPILTWKLALLAVKGKKPDV